MDFSPPTSRGAGRRPELLAPAGGPEAGYAALAYGADALYLGLKRFSARAEAANFTLEELDALTAFAHTGATHRRVFVTINTLVLESEIPEVLTTLAALREIGVDALIVQDLGVARILRRHFPELELHASTQMAVHSLRGVEGLARLGIRRAVVARELTLAEIRQLCTQTDVEIECFIHGALCYSYSGLCLFSSHALGRSANRGRCAYVCGGSFTPEGKEASVASALPFAMKDLALPGRVAELAEAGVACFKIEGRKKSPLYVATVTDFYRRVLDGSLDTPERKSREADLRTVFSRPWTELYVSSRRQNASGEARAVGHRGARVGTVTAVRGNRREGTLLRLKSIRPLEAHDGLQVEIPGFVKPFGFSIEKLRPAGTAGWTFAAGPGELEVALPPNHPMIPVGAPVHCTSSQAVKRSFRWTVPRPGEFRSRQPLRVVARVTPEKLEVTAGVCDRNTGRAVVEVTRELVEPFGEARDPTAAAQGARTAFERLGDTPFSLDELSVENTGGLYVSPSQWNRVRRATAEALEAALQQRQNAEIHELADRLAREAGPSGEPAGAPDWSLKTDRVALLSHFTAEDWEGVSEVVVTVDGEDLAPGLADLENRIGRDRIRLALPPLLRAWDEERVQPWIETLLADGWRRWEAANLAHWGHLGLRVGNDPGDADIDLSADWPLYVVNASAARGLLDLGLSGFVLSPEDGSENTKTLLSRFSASATVVVYQHTPLFVSETCPRATLEGRCEGAGRCDFGGSDLVSDFGDRVRVLSRRCRTIVISRKPFCLSTELPELASAGARRFRVDLQYSEAKPEEILSLWREVRAGRTIRESHQANYRRGLL